MHRFGASAGYAKSRRLCCRDLGRAPHIIRAAVEPAEGCVIVVRTGVANAVLADIGQFESGMAHIKLQDTHARELVAIAQGGDFGRYDPQVFGDDRQIRPARR